MDSEQRIRMEQNARKVRERMGGPNPPTPAEVQASWNPLNEPLVPEQEEIDLLVELGSDPDMARSAVQSRRARGFGQTRALLDATDRKSLAESIRKLNETTRRQDAFDREIGEIMGHSDVQPAQPQAERRPMRQSDYGKGPAHQYRTVPGPVDAGSGQSEEGKTLVDEGSIEAYRHRKPSYLATPEEIEHFRRLGLYTGGTHLPSQEDVDMFKRGYVYTVNNETGARGWQVAYPQPIASGPGEPGRLGTRSDLRQPLMDRDTGKPMEGTHKYEKFTADSPFGQLEVYTPTKEFRDRLHDDKQARLREKLEHEARVHPDERGVHSLEALRAQIRRDRLEDQDRRKGAVAARAQIHHSARRQGVSEGVVEHQRNITDPGATAQERGSAMIAAGFAAGNQAMIQAGVALMRGDMDVRAVQAIGAEGGQADQGPLPRMRADNAAGAQLPIGQQIADLQNQYRAQFVQEGQPINEDAMAAFVVQRGQSVARSAAASLLSGQADADTDLYLQQWTQYWVRGAGGQGQNAQTQYRQWLTALGIADSREAANLFARMSGRAARSGATGGGAPQGPGDPVPEVPAPPQPF